MEENMRETGEPRPQGDPFNLRRFVDAQAGIYDQALAELRHGHKRSHWMWFIFPQIDGLGKSPTAQHFAITSIEEGRQYLHHPLLGPRLLECTEVVLAIEGRSASQIFGYPDDLKLKSSMTLFANAAEADSVFVRVLEKYFSGEMDGATVRILDTLAGATRREQS